MFEQMLRTSLWNGALGRRRLVDFWYFLISLSATVPGLNLCFLASLMPPSAGAVFLLVLTMAFDASFLSDKIALESIFFLERTLVGSIFDAVFFYFGMSRLILSFVL